MIITIQQQTLDHIQTIEHYKQVLALLSWDTNTYAPKNSKKQLAKIQSTLATKLHLLQTNSDFRNNLELLLQEDLNELQRKIFNLHLKEFTELSSISIEDIQQFSLKKALTSTNWAIAKLNNNFQLVQDDLKEIIETKKRFANLKNPNLSPYDQLLNEYEPDILTKTIDPLFENIKSTIIPFLNQIRNVNSNLDTSFIKNPFPIEKQKILGKELLKSIGYNFESGQMGVTQHPFSAGIHSGDARLAVKYVGNNVKVGALMTLHEGGHSLYTQNINEKLVDTGLGKYTSMGFHESQSIFWEKIIGKHEEFWKIHFPFLQQHHPEVYKNVSFNQFFFALSEVKPSLTRYEADDITYPLHIIIRYEIEKELFTNEVNVKDLPEIWNAKYKNYLDIRPTNYSEGILQDIHWYSGSFGYFPSYLLGFIYAAQLREAIIKDYPNFDQLIAAGDFSTILQWQTQNIHQFGKLKSSKEILNSLNISEISERPLLEYLIQKYGRLYSTFALK